MFTLYPNVALRLSKFY